MTVTVILAIIGIAFAFTMKPDKHLATVDGVTPVPVQVGDQDLPEIEQPTNGETILKQHIVQPKPKKKKKSFVSPKLPTMHSEKQKSTSANDIIGGTHDND